MIAPFSNDRDLAQKKNKIFNDSLRQLLNKDGITDYIAHYKITIMKKNEFSQKMRQEGYTFVLEEDVRRSLVQLESLALQSIHITPIPKKYNPQKENRNNNEVLRKALKTKMITDYDSHLRNFLRLKYEVEQKMKNEGHIFVMEKDVKQLFSELEAKVVHQKEKPWAYKDYFGEGVDTAKGHAKHNEITQFKHICTMQLAENDWEEINIHISQNRVDVSAYKRGTLFDFECYGQPQYIHCKGQTFRSALALCVCSLKSINNDNILSALENYYNDNGYINISLQEETISNLYSSESKIHGTVEKNDIRFKIKLSFDSGYLVQKIRAPKQVKAANPNPTINIDNMDGHQFELFCADILRKNNYENVTVTQGSGDQGIDIIAYKDGIKYGIQCKCYSSPIGNHAVQEVFAGKTFYQCHVGIVLTNNYFTPSAKDLAKHNAVVLWDRDKLLQLINNRRCDGPY